MLKLFFAALTAGFLFNTQPLQAQISNPDGSITPADSDLIWAQTLEGSYFNEFWNYQFYFENGVKAHVIFSAANFGSLKSPVTGVRISVLYPDGEVYQIAREYPIERLVQDRDNHIFRLHPERDVWFEGALPEEHRIRINTSKDGVQYDLDLRFDNIAEGLKWGDGQFRIHDEKIGIITHIPYADVRGHISVDGRKKEVSGTGYMDHTFQNQTTTRLMHSGYRFVHHTDRENWDILYFLLPDKSRDRNTIGYRLTSNQGEVELNGIKKITSTSDGRAFGTNIPRIVEVEFSDGSTKRIARTEDEEKFSILGELGWVARRAARSFLGGEVVDFRGEGSLLGRSNRPVRGDYNFFIVD